MAKPTEETDWATLGAGGGGASSALRTATDTNRKQFGWQTTPNNLSTDQGERPNLNHQNYWQYAVHQWIDWLGGQIPDPDGPTETDLWEWEMPDIEEIECTTSTISFKIAVTSNTSTSINSNPEFVKESSIIGLFLEMQHYFPKSVGFKIVDNADVVWHFAPLKTQTIFNNQASGSAGVTGDLEISVNVSSTNFTVYKDGVLVTDASSFSALSNRTAIDNKNPSGIRAVVYDSTAVASAAGNAVFGQTLRRRRYRGLVGTYAHDLNDGQGVVLSLPIENSRYYLFGVNALYVASNDWFLEFQIESSGYQGEDLYSFLWLPGEANSLIPTSATSEVSSRVSTMQVLTQTFGISSGNLAIGSQIVSSGTGSFARNFALDLSGLNEISPAFHSHIWIEDM